MTRLNLVLLLAVLASSLYLVSVQYESRRLFSDLDKARSVAHRLEADNERLQVEKRAQATPLRVERLAKEQLKMRTATPAITDYVIYDAGSAVVPDAVAAASSARRGPTAAGRIQ
jgi:cell division protein FtsL